MKNIKLHVGCGDIFLENYLNLDIKGKLISEVSGEELEANRTTLPNYLCQASFTYPTVISQSLQKCFANSWPCFSF